MSGVSRYRPVLGAVASGLLVAVATGLYERDVVSIVEARYFGYPLVWRITNLNEPTEYVPTALAIDAGVWSAASLAAFVLLNVVRTRLPTLSRISTRRGTEAAPPESKARILLIYVLVLAVLMKGVGEVVHEAVGHGLVVVLFGGSITSLNISLLWPYRLSSIGMRGNFEAWQRPWIDGGGILACLATSGVLQAWLLWRGKQWRLAVPLFWLAFWTFLNPVGYLIIGGIHPFGDIAQLIAEGVLNQASSLAIGLGIFVVAFFALSRIFTEIVDNTGWLTKKRQLRASLSILWLSIPVMTGMAVAGLGFLSASSPLLFAMSVLPSAVAFGLPENVLSRIIHQLPDER